MNHSTEHETPPEASVAAILADAYDAPPVPASLVRRLDAGITDQWGASPALEPQAAGTIWSNVLRGTKVVSGWPIAGALAATLMLAFFVIGGSKTYAWTSVVDAITRQPLLHLTGASGNWSLDSSTIASKSESQRSRMVLSFLLRAVGQSTEDLPLSGLKVADQSWERINNSIAMHIVFTTDDDQQIDLDLMLDPDTSLPQTARIRERSNKPQASSPTAILTSTEPGPRELTITYPRRNLLPSGVEGDQMVATTPDRPSIGRSGDALAPAPKRSLVGALPLGAATTWRPVSIEVQSAKETLAATDELLNELWTERSVQPVAEANDSELLRRVYLDLAGRTPTVTEARNYLEQTAADRYERLVDQLLESPDHASHLATTWRTFLIPDGVDLTAFGGLEAFDRWLADQFGKDEPYDKIVRRLLLAEGRLSKSGPLLFYSAAKLDPDQLAARTSRVFLGIRLECAQCHDHPFEPWTQEDFWSYAAFFAQISRPKGELATASKLMQVRDVDRGEVMLPETDRVIPPRFLDHADDPSATRVARRQRLASWLTSAQNPYFARATVNRVWAQMFGRGIVDPVDDFGSKNQPISPELLDLLAGQLIQTNFNLRSVLRTVALSRAYRLSSASDDSSEIRLECFAQMGVKTLTAAQLYDCISMATRLDAASQRQGTATTVARFGNSQRDQFLQQFASPATNRVDYLSGIPQALTMMNGDLVAMATGTNSGGLLKSLDAPFFTNKQRVEVLFLATLSRPPTAQEQEVLSQTILSDPDVSLRHDGLSDLLWALLNSAEFTLNH
ncbi:hypothetical protein K227x_29970 [Rubripirellula lacrimiformis]|uniref:Protein containing DUF1549 n=1 Tax=Rubripirellula lacrimiformis TaxID=1930273 RepID=A0A517NBU7_9BACT|nr:DUF1549 and DUF1553 domain-containing protein [Rubripirellula lacrimiformis]QDT04604.1 hypothetical protein K227x_29970 [Rubripirellula lacrimiformis]